MPTELELATLQAFNLDQAILGVNQQSHLSYRRGSALSIHELVTTQGTGDSYKNVYSRVDDISKLIAEVISRFSAVKKPLPHQVVNGLVVIKTDVDLLKKTIETDLRYIMWPDQPMHTSLNYTTYKSISQRIVTLFQSIKKEYRDSIPNYADYHKWLMP